MRSRVNFSGLNELCGKRCEIIQKSLNFETISTMTSIISFIFDRFFLIFDKGRKTNMPRYISIYICYNEEISVVVIPGSACVKVFTQGDLANVHA